MRVVTAVTVLILGMAAGSAQVADPASGAARSPDSTTFQRIDDFLRQEQRDAGIPGLALAVVVGDSVAHVSTLGVADASGRPVTPDTPFLLASVSKAFAAVSIMQLVERRQLELDAPVQRYVPWFRVADEQASTRITVRHLLHHTAGLAERRPANDDDLAALERFVRDLATMELASSPGESHEYTNAAYNVLALVVEAVSGTPYHQYLEDNIYDPLGMSHSHALEADALADGAAEGYYRWFGLWSAPTRVDVPRAEAASATSWSSANDMARWLIAHLRGGVFGDARILSEAGMETVHTPYAVAGEAHGYAMGWVVRPLWEEIEVLGARSFDLPALVEHGGTWSTGHTYAAIVPERDWGFVLLTNLYDETNAPRFWAVEQGILRILSDKEPVGAQGTVAPLVEYGKQIVIALLALQLVSVLWAVSRIQRWRPVAGRMPRGRPAAAAIVIPLVLDALVLWLYFVEAPSLGPLENMLRWYPDVAVVFVPTVLSAAVWGPVRTLLFTALFARSPTTVAATGDGMGP